MAILEIEMEFPLMENKRKNQYERVSWKMAANNRNTQNCLPAINLISARHRTQNDDTQFLFSPKIIPKWEISPLIAIESVSVLKSISQFISESITYA